MSDDETTILIDHRRKLQTWCRLKTDLRPGMKVRHRTGGPKMIVASIECSEFEAYRGTSRGSLSRFAELDDDGMAALAELDSVWPTVVCTFWRDQEGAFNQRAFLPHELVEVDE